MDQIHDLPRGGLVEVYVNRVIENGSWSVWLHISALAISAIALVLAFRRVDHAFVLKLSLSPLAFGFAATCVHAFNVYMVLGPQLFNAHKADIAQDVIHPFYYSVYLTAITSAACLIVQRGRPAVARSEPQPQPPPRWFFYRSADGSVCGPATDSQLRAMFRMRIISAETPVAEVGSPDQWTDFASAAGNNVSPSAPGT
jgi:hypothetical protein